VLVAPLLQRAEDDLEFLAGRRELVGEPGPGARLLIRLAFHHPVFDQRREPVRQHVRSDAQPAPELGEPRHAQEGFPQHEESPPLAEHAEAAFDRAG